MDKDLVAAVQQIAEQLKSNNEQTAIAQARFRDQVLEELKRLNRNLEQMIGRLTLGDL